MGLFKCKLCGNVYSTEELSLKSNLCRSCFIRLEDMYTNSGIHDYIRDNGLSKEDFNPEELAHELKMNPRSIKLLLEMGFMDRDIQVYSQTDRQRRKILFEELSKEINKMNKRHAKINTETEAGVEIKIKSKSVSYGGRIYKRRSRI